MKTPESFGFSLFLLPSVARATFASAHAEIFSGMIPQAEGRALIETLEGNGPEQGALVPMNCKKDSGIGDKNQQCHAAIKADRELVEGLVLVRMRLQALPVGMFLSWPFVGAHQAPRQTSNRGGQSHSFVYSLLLFLHRESTLVCQRCPHRGRETTGTLQMASRWRSKRGRVDVARSITEAPARVGCVHYESMP